jgi:hypothetical protein
MFSALLFATFYNSIQHVAKSTIPNYGNLFVYAANNDESTDNNNLCNKLFETCKTNPSKNITPPQEGSPEEDKSRSFSEKYLEQKNPTSVVTSPTNESSAPALNESAAPAVKERIKEDSSNTNQTNVTSPKVSPELTGVQTFVSNYYGFQMDYPVGWKIREASKDSNQATELVSLPDSDNDAYLEKMTVRVSQISPHISLENYTKQVSESIEKMKFFNIVDSGPITLSENPAYRIIGVRSGNQTINVIDEWTIKDEKAYRVTFYYEEAKSDAYIPMALDMYESFKITG